MQRLLSSPDAVLFPKSSDSDNNHFNVRRSAKLNMGSGKLRRHGKKSSTSPPRLLSNFLNFSSDSPNVLRRRRHCFRDSKQNHHTRPVPPSTKPPPSQSFLEKPRHHNLPSSPIPLVSETPQKVLAFRKRAKKFVSSSPPQPPPPQPTPLVSKKSTFGLQNRRLSDLLPRVPLTLQCHDGRFAKRTVSDLSSQVSLAANSRDATAGTNEHSKRRLSDLSSPTHLSTTPMTPTLDVIAPIRKLAHTSPHSSTPLSTKNPDQSIPKREPCDLPSCVSSFTETAEDLLAATALIPEVQSTREIRRALRRANHSIPKQNVSNGGAPDMSLVSGQPLSDTVTVQETTVKHVTRVMERCSRPLPDNSVPSTQMQSPSKLDPQIESKKSMNVKDDTKLPTPENESGITTCNRMPERPGSPEPAFLRTADIETTKQTKSALAARLPTLKLKLGKRANRLPILSRPPDGVTKVQPQVLETKELKLQPDEENKTKMKRIVTSELNEEQVMTLLEKATTVEELVKLLRRYGESLLVTSGAMKKLTNAVSSRESKEVIWLCGGVDAIIMAMGRYADVSGVQVDGAQVLAKSVCNHAENKDALVNDFGLDAVISGMRGFPRDAEVQTWSCQALHNVAVDNMKHKEVVGRKGGVSAAIEALASHGMNAKVVEESTLLLHTLVCGVCRNVDRLANSKDWAALLLDILGANANSMSDEVQTKLLDVLAEGAKAHLMSVGDGALTAALFAMSRNVHRKEVLSVGAAAARALVEDRANGMDKSLSAAGAVASLLDMLQCSASVVSGLKAT